MPDYERQHGIQWTRVYWSALTEDVQAVEARCHGALAPYWFAFSPPGATEIYHLIPAKAVRIAERFVIAPPGSGAPYNYVPPSQVPWRHCAEIAVAAAAVAWPALRQLQRLLRSARRI